MKGNYAGIEGFFYSGHRLLTPAQVRSLKEDSTKWNRERMRSESRGIRGPDYIRSHAYEESIQRQEESEGHEYHQEPYTHEPPRPAGRTVDRTTATIFAPATSHAGPNPNYYYTEDGRPFYDVAQQRYIPPFVPRPPGAIETELTSEHITKEASIPRVIADTGRPDYEPYPMRGGRGERERGRGVRGPRDPRRERGDRRERDRAGRRDASDEDMDDEEMPLSGAVVPTRPATGTVVIRTAEGYVGYWTHDAMGQPRFMSTPHLEPGTPITVPEY